MNGNLIYTHTVPVFAVLRTSTESYEAKDNFIILQHTPTLNHELIMGPSWHTYIHTYQFLSSCSDTAYGFLGVLTGFIHGQSLHHFLHDRILQALLLPCFSL